MPAPTATNHRDAYTWIAHQHGGEQVAEYDLDGSERGWAVVDLAATFAVQIQPTRDGLPAPLVVVPAEARPVFFRRRSIEVNPTTEEEVARNTLTCIGWEHLDGQGVYLFVADDGRCVLSADRNVV